MKHFYVGVFRNTFLLLLCLCCFTCITAQNIYLVDGAPTGITTATPVTTVDAAAWNNATGSLQAALNAASAGGGGQIWVKAGIYKPSDYPNGCINCGSTRDRAFLLRNNVAVYGGFAGTETLLSQRGINANPTILSGDIGTLNVISDNSYHVLITVNSDSTTILDGLTVTGGNANGTGTITIMGQNSRQNTGGGMLNDSLSSPSIRNCNFSANNSSGSSGAIANIYNCKPKITDCVFTNNSGGGIHNNDFSHPIIINCAFTNNNGSALSNTQNCVPSISNSTFTNNSGTFNGGISNSSVSRPYITNCSFTNTSMFNDGLSTSTITNCTFTSSGMTNAGYASLIVTNCIFANGSSINSLRGDLRVTNSTFTNNVNGISFSNSSLYVTNSIFVSNSSNGIDCGNASTATITNCTFVNNQGYGIHNSSHHVSGTTVTNCILWGNGANNAGPGIHNTLNATPAVATYSIVQGGYPDSGNVNTDPLFRNTALPAGADGVFGTADDGLQLQPCSPAINNGSNAAVPFGITTDLIGAIRIQGGVVDRGAYEYQYPNLATNNDNVTATTSPGTITPFTTNCQSIASLLSTGASPVSGNVTAKLWVDGAQSNYNGRTYVKRHYEMIPAVNASTATARITLYATQPELNDFNNYDSIKLPTSPNDVAGIARLRILKFGGQSSNGSGTPASYTQPGTAIDPADSNIVWNNTMQRWEITFDVTGFSGFFIVNDGNIILPLTLLNFGVKSVATNSAKINWRTAHELNTGFFELQRSLDGYHFTTINKVQAEGNAQTVADYSYIENGLKPGLYYYRLRMVDKDGQEVYSAVVSLQIKSYNVITLYPVPAKDVVWLNGSAISLTGSNALLMDVQGRILQTIRINHWPQPINISALAKGNYLIKLPNETTVKLIKQ